MCYNKSTIRELKLLKTEKGNSMKLSTRDFLDAVIKLTADHMGEDFSYRDITLPDIQAAAEVLLKKLDDKNAKTRAKTSEKHAADDTAVKDFFTANPDEWFTRYAVAEAIGMTPEKVSTRANILVANGFLTCEKRTVTNAEGRKQKLNHYKVA